MENIKIEKLDNDPNKNCGSITLSNGINIPFGEGFGSNTLDEALDLYNTMKQTGTIETIINILENGGNIKSRT